MEQNRNKTLEMVQLALFSAIIFALAFTPFLGYIPIGFTRATIIHIPVIIGAVILGPKKGAFLGAIFGLTSLINNTFNPTATSFVFTPFYSIGETNGNFLSLIICFVPRILVGVVPYYVYCGIKKLFGGRKGSDPTALAFAGLSGALTNAILVFVMVYFFFASAYAQALDKPVELLFHILMALIATNAVPEAIVAAILTTAICSAIHKFQSKKA